MCSSRLSDGIVTIALLGVVIFACDPTLENPSLPLIRKSRANIKMFPDVPAKNLRTLIDQ